MKIDLTISDIVQIQRLVKQRKTSIFGWAKKYDAGYLSEDSEHEIKTLNELYDKLLDYRKDICTP